jgi:hypothetical protein
MTSARPKRSFASLRASVDVYGRCLERVNLFHTALYGNKHIYLMIWKHKYVCYNDILPSTSGKYDDLGNIVWGKGIAAATRLLASTS